MDLQNIEYFLKCPLCLGTFLVETFENHLIKTHKIIEIEVYGFELNKIINSKYFFDFTIDDKKNHNTKGFDVEKGLNNYIQCLPGDNFAKVYQNEGDSNEGNIVVGWDDIFFMNNKIKISKIDLAIKNNILSFPNSIEALNQIKESYFKAKFNGKFNFHYKDGYLDVNKSSGYQQLIELIDAQKPNLTLHNIVSDSDEFEFVDTKGLENSQIMKLDCFGRYNNKYLVYLSKVHNAQKKIIPIIEYNNGIKEYSIIFQIRTPKNSHIIVWENLNINRATYVFKDTENVIDKIKDYIVNKKIKNKRLRLSSKLHSDNLIKKELQFYRILKHSEFNSYIEKMQAIININ